MNKIFLSVVCIVFQLTVIAQSGEIPAWLDFRKANNLSNIPSNSLDSRKVFIENEFIKYPENNLTYTFKNKEYKYNNLGTLVDTCFSILIENKLPNWRIEHFEKYYNYDLEFRNLIDKINTLPYKRSGYFSKNAEEIKNKIQNINDPVKKIYSLLHFGGHFFKNNDSINLENYYWSEVIKIAYNNRNTISGPECYQAIADFYTNIFQLPTGLESYFDAAFLYDSLKSYREFAKIQTKIGELYNYRNEMAYIDKAASHFEIASNSYLFLKDTVSCIISRLKMVETKMYMCWFLNDPFEIKSIKDQLLEVVFTAKHYLYRNNLKKEYRNYLYMTLGNYYEYKGDLESMKIAKTYYYAGLIVAMNDCKNYTLNDIYYSLFKLANLNGRMGNEIESLKYMDMAFNLATKEKNIYRRHFCFLKKADNYCALKKYKDALIAAKNGLNFSDIETYSDADKNELRLDGFNTCSIIYGNLNYPDSAELYYTKFNSIRAGFTEELNELNQLENNFSDKMVNKEINKVLDEKDFTIKSKNSEIRNKLIILKTLRDSLIKSSDFLRLITQSINFKNRELDNKNIGLKENERKLKRDSIRMDNMVKTISARQQTLNYTIPFATGITALLILIGGIVYYRAKQKNKRLENENAVSQLKVTNQQLENKRLENENAVAELKVSNQRLKNHEFKELSAIIEKKTSLLLSSVSENGFYNDNQAVEKLKTLKRLTTMVNEYICQYYKSSKETTNSINGEIKLAKLYTDIYKMKYELSPESIKLDDLIEDNFVKNKIQVPSHLINNFIINSIKHGLVGQDNISVFVEAETTNIGYKIIIEDNGCGINQSKSNKSTSNETGTGIQLAIDSAEAYNRNVTNDFTIFFSEKNIVDKADIKKGKGTKVIIEFIKKAK